MVPNGMLAVRKKSATLLRCHCQFDCLWTPQDDAGVHAKIRAVAKRYLPRFDRIIIAIGLLEQALAPCRQVECQPGFAELDFFHVDHIDVRQIARLQYAAIIQTPGGAYGGMMNLGARPTVGDDRLTVEAHLFDFDGDLYGAAVRIDLVAPIRPIRRFSGLPELTAQLAEDGVTARAALTRFG